MSRRQADALWMLIIVGGVFATLLLVAVLTTGPEPVSRPCYDELGAPVSRCAP